MKLLQSILAALLLAAGPACFADADAAATGSCDRPATTSGEQSSSAVQMPDYAVDTDADETADPRAEATINAWTGYQRSIAAALADSPDPRDWALATLVHNFDALSQRGSDTRGDVLLRRALDATPDDRVVLWIAVAEGNRSPANGELRNRALQRLRIQEPGNAAVWLEDLNDTIRQKRESAAGTALAHMAGSATFDGHQAELLQAMLDVYRRFPPSDELRALSAGQTPPASDEAFAMTSAAAVTAAVALPSFQHLVNACRVDPASGRNPARSAECATVGRLLAAHADTLIATHIGQAVLRVSKTYTDDDVRAARAGDWIYAQFVATIPTEEDDASLVTFGAYQADWIETGNELEAMRRTAQRAGSAAEAPDDWLDSMSPFAPTRSSGARPTAGKTDSR